MKNWIIRGLVAILVITIVSLFIIYPDEVKEKMSQFLFWLSENRITGPFALIGFLVVATVLVLPGSILTIGTGVALMKAYDSTWMAIFVGSTTVWLGTWLGSILAMLIARYLSESKQLNLQNDTNLSMHLTKL